MKTPLVNLFGGPGAGKSTLAARIFAEVKEKGINAEYVPEFAKDIMWEETHALLGNQLYVFAMQQHRLWKLQGKVDLIITDAPLMSFNLYGKPSHTFRNLISEEHEKYDNINIFLNRVKPYNPKGRTQTEEGAKAMDGTTFTMMNNIYGRSGKFFNLVVDGEKESVPLILNYIETRLYDNSIKQEKVRITI